MSGGSGQRRGARGGARFRVRIGDGMSPGTRPNVQQAARLREKAGHTRAADGCKTRGRMPYLCGLCEFKH